MNNDPTNPNSNWTANLPIPLRDQDKIDSMNGEITIVLEQPSARDNYFVAEEPNDRGTATIKDIDIPKISIIEKVRIIASKDAVVTLTSNIESVHSHSILVKASNSAGFNFLDTTVFENGVAKPIENVRFTTPEGTMEPWTYTFSVPTIADNSEPFGSISVEILENPDADSYVVDIEKRIGAIIVSTLPVLSIAPLNLEVDEGNDNGLIFIVTATEDPGMEGLMVNYTINEDENSNYRHPSVTIGPQDPINLTFSQADPTDNTSPWNARIRVQLRDSDLIDTSDGAITVVLNLDSAEVTSYVVADSPTNKATAIIKDLDVPVFSISDAPETVAGQAATFTITSNIQSTQPHTLIVSPKNESGEFLNTDVGGESEVNRIISDVNFTQAPPYTYSLAISTKEDNSNTSGLISVKFVENTEANTYNIAETPADIATVGITNFGVNIPTLSISDSSPFQQSEGSMGVNNRLTFNVTLSKAVNYPITVNYKVSDYNGPLSPATRDVDFTLDDDSLLIEAGVTLGMIHAIMIGDDDFETDEGFNINISIAGSSSIEIIKNTGIGTIKNDDEEPVIPRTIGEPEISITNNQGSITEGEVAIFNISVLRPDEHTAEINVQISVFEVGSFIGWRVPRIFTIPANQDDDELEIPTMDDTNHEPEGGRITVTIERRNNYTINQNNSSDFVRVIDNEVSPDTTPLPRISVAQTAVDSILNRFIPASSTSRSAIAGSTFHEQPTISVFASDLEISEGESAEFDIVATGEFTNQFVVSFAISQHGNFLPPELPTQVQIPSTASKAKVRVNTQDDQIAEADGTISIQLQQSNTYKVSAQNRATIIVSDAIDRQLRKDEIANRSGEILPQYLQLLGGNILATTSQRIQQAQDDTNSPSSYQINGAEGLTQLISTSGEAINSKSESLRSILGNSAFEFDFYSEDNLIYPISIWGLGEFDDITSSSISTASNWRGDAFTGHLGFDTKLSHNILMGMSSSTVDLDSGYAIAEINEFLFQSRSTTFNPYLSWTSPNNDAHIQSIVGYGLGEINIKQPGYQYETLQSHSSNLSFSGSKKLYGSDRFLTGRTSELSLVGEFWIANLQIVEKAGIIDETSLTAQHHRVAVAGSHKRTFSNGSSLEPSLSIGVLHDGKDQATLRGVELRNGVSYSAPIGLELAGNARLIQEQTSQSKLWNLQGSLAYDYGRDQLGPQVEVSGTYSVAPTDYSNLLNMSIIDGVDTKSLENSINTKFQYGLSICGEICLVTPYASYDFDVNGLEKSQHGAILSVGSLFNLELEHTYNPNSTVSTNQSVQFKSKLNW